MDDIKPGELYPEVSKRDFIKRLAEKLDVSQEQAYYIYNGFMNTLAETLLNNEGVVLYKIGKFEIKQSNLRKARNYFNNNEIVDVPPRPYVKFKFAREFKALYRKYNTGRDENGPKRDN